MKNAKKLVLAALMVAVMAFALCACGSGNADGTYVVTETNGQNVEEALKAYEATGNKLTAEELCTITISGKTFNMNAMGVKAEGTVEIDGENLKMTSDGATANATLKDGVLTLNMNGTNMVLKKK
jgi:uncharacterized lipoprotein YehR (DUF1307 family)